MTVKVGRDKTRKSISSAKQGRGQKVSSIIQSDIPGSSVDKDICTVNVRDKVGVEKYLRKNCYHRIECFAGNSLAAFMWRRPLNSAALVALTYRGPMRVSNGTSTQVVAWTTDKWRAKIIQRDIYNVRNP